MCVHVCVYVCMYVCMCFFPTRLEFRRIVDKRVVCIERIKIQEIQGVVYLGGKCEEQRFK